MDNHDLISVIMPCYNAEEHLQESIDCVLQQSYENLELIIIDDGSTDNSLDILRSYQDRIVVITQNNKGPGPARNKGILRSKGKYIAFLDADDYWDVDFLTEMYKTLSASDASLAYCGWQNVGSKNKSGEPYIPPDYEAGNKVEYFLRAAAPWPIHAALVRREVLNEVGNFNEKWPTCMDYDLWLRIGLNYRIIGVEKVLAFYRHHGEGQITSKQWRQAKNTWLIKKDFINKNPHIMESVDRHQLRKWVNGALLKRGYTCYWRRDLLSAQKIFRIVFMNGGWDLNDAKYIIPALLPKPIYISIMKRIDNHREK